MSRQVQAYSAEIKAAALAALLAGQAVGEVAAAYSIPTGTLHSWKSRQKGAAPAIVAPDQKERVGELLVAYLEANLEALTTQLQVFRDETWLKQQSASEAAVLHGVLADKAIRILEAAERARQAEAEL